MKNFTYLVRVAALCLLCSFLTRPVLSQQVEKHLVLPTGEQIGFLEYKPATYSSERNTKHPVILFLHGIGERGNGTSDLKYVARIGLPRMIKQGHNMQFTWNGKTETFLVLSPQCPQKYSMWPELIVSEMIRYAKENLHVDTNRIYITGLSMGGGGTYRYISRQQRQAESVAAAATICAPCTFTGDGGNVARARLPMWSFHAANDSIALAMCTEMAVKKVNEAKPEVKPLKTIWPDGGHNVWDRVYTDTAHKFNGVVNIYEWFLGQSKSYKPNKMPVANAGVDRRISSKVPVVQLDASASSDPDGTLVRYVWKKISGAEGVVIAQTMGGNSSTTATGLKHGVYDFELSVVDDRAAYTKDTVRITVDSLVGAAPTKPVDTVPATVPGPGTIVDTVKKDTTKQSPVPVKDAVTSDTVQPKPAPRPNRPPVARTTQDREIPLEWNYFPYVSGWPSTDADGYIAKFRWEKVSGPDTFNIVSPNTCGTRINNLVRGTYVFRVTAYDNKGASSYADVRITMTTFEDRKKVKQTTQASARAVVQSQAVAAEVPLTVLTPAVESRAYPNPTTGLVHLEYASDARGKSVLYIRDAAGRVIRSVVFEKREQVYRHDLDLSKMPDGFYHIEVRTGNTIGMQTKVLKQ